LSTQGKNQIDLADLTWVSGKMKASYSGTTTQGTLTVSNGTNSVPIKLIGNYLGKTSWILSKDAGTGTLVKDPPVDGSLTPNASGGADGGIDFSEIAFGANTTVGYTPERDNSGGTLTVSDGGAVQCMALIGQYVASSFAAASDGHGGTVVTDLSSTHQPLLAPSHA
jgi:hypothetical protein